VSLVVMLSEANSSFCRFILTVPMSVFSVSHSKLRNAAGQLTPPPQKQKPFGSTRFTWMTYFDFKTVNFTEW